MNIFFYNSNEFIYAKYIVKKYDIMCLLTIWYGGQFYYIIMISFYNAEQNAVRKSS